jgi:hypothetical protein
VLSPRLPVQAPFRPAGSNHGLDRGDGWHRVVRGSFTAGPLDFCAGADPDMPGFYFEEADNGTPHRPAALAGPLTSILAIRQAASAARHLTALESSGARRRGHLGRGGRTAANIAPC